MSFPTHYFTLLVLILGGCAHRLPLDDHLFRTQIRDVVDLAGLRIYLDRRVVIERQPLERPKTPTNDRGHLDEVRRGKRQIISRNAPGEIIDIDTHMELPRIWVTFDPRCSSRDCAFAFVAADDGTAFRLTQLPHDPSFRAPELNARGFGRRWKLTRGRLRSLAESVPVYRNRAYGRRPVVVALDVAVDRQKVIEVEHSVGRDRPGPERQDPPPQTE